MLETKKTVIMLSLITLILVALYFFLEKYGDNHEHENSQLIKIIVVVAAFVSIFTMIYLRREFWINLSKLWKYLGSIKNLILHFFKLRWMIPASTTIHIFLFVYKSSKNDPHVECNDSHYNNMKFIKREDAVYWSALVAIILLLYFVFSDGQFSVIFTLAGTVQTFGFALIVLKIRKSRSVTGLSR